MNLNIWAQSILHLCTFSSRSSFRDYDCVYFCSISTAILSFNLKQLLKILKKAGKYLGPARLLTMKYHLFIWYFQKYRKLHMSELTWV